jgi:hypothetical protein
VAFGIAFLGALMVAMIQGPKPFYADSHEYWTMGESFVRNGHFSLLNFDNFVRGYTLALIYRELQALAGSLRWTSSSALKLSNALLFALIGSVLGPRLAEMAWPRRRWGIWRRLALTGLLVVFWSGYLNFPLSDFPALAAVLVAIVATGSPGSPGWMLGCGLACGLAINIRPGYLPLAPIVFALMVVGWRERRGPWAVSMSRRALCAGLLAVGFVAVSLPQSLASQSNFDSWNPIPGGMFNLQLTDGLIQQRYETYVGATPHLAIYSEDRAGVELLAEHGGHQIEGWLPYSELIATHPVTMGGLFLRRFVNGVDLRYTTPYIEHLHHDGILWLRIVGFLLVFLALVRVLWAPARRRLGPARWRYPAALLLCGLPSLSSHAEVRYMLPFLMLAYILVLAAGWPNPIPRSDAGLRRFKTAAILCASALAFTALVWHITSLTSRNMHAHGPERPSASSGVSPSGVG